MSCNVLVTIENIKKVATWHSFASVTYQRSQGVCFDFWRYLRYRAFTKGKLIDKHFKMSFSKAFYIVLLGRKSIEMPHDESFPSGHIDWPEQYLRYRYLRYWATQKTRLHNFCMHENYFLAIV